MPESCPPEPRAARWRDVHLQRMSPWRDCSIKPFDTFTLWSLGGGPVGPVWERDQPNH